MSDMATISESLHETFCRNLRLARRDRGITLTQLAERLGCSLPAVSQLQSGRNSPGLERVEQVARALDYPPHVLLNPDAFQENPE